MPRPGDRKEGEQQKELSGATGEARTHDPLLKRQVLLPTELQSHLFFSSFSIYIITNFFEKVK